MTIEQEITNALTATGSVRSVGNGLEICYTPDTDIVTDAKSASEDYAAACRNIHRQLRERQDGTDENGEPVSPITMAWIVEEGRSYFKIISDSATHPGTRRSGWAFVSKSTGDYYQAATFAKKGALLGNLLAGRPVSHLPTF